VDEPDLRDNIALREPADFPVDPLTFLACLTAACVIHDPVWNRRTIIEKSGSDSTVVWNPWSDKTKGTSEMAPDGWKEMICIETANAADNAAHLAPGGCHKLTATIRVQEARSTRETVPTSTDRLQSTLRAMTMNLFGALPT
jgi:hypothetical protein